MSIISAIGNIQTRTCSYCNKDQAAAQLAQLAPSRITIFARMKKRIKLFIAVLYI